MKKCVVLGVSGGIAVYKAADLTSMLVKVGYDVYVIMTKNATQFVTPLTFSTLTGNEVVTDMFAPATSWDVEHIALAKRADVFAIVPATANVIGKMAHGIADDMLSTTVMATKAPILLAPAMNTGMLENLAVVENLTKLKSMGYHIVEPAEGRLACGDIGKGKLAPVEEIFDAIVALATPKQDLMGKTILITAGPTREALDPVRYITNHSSGKMGYALAQAAADRGANVILVSGPVNITEPKGVTKIDILTANDMHAVVMDKLPQADIIIKAAAPADYSPTEVAENKIKKQGERLTIAFKENIDISADVGKNKGDKVLVVFAAETENLLENAKSKIKSKNADLVVANDVTIQGAGFNSDNNTATLIGKDGYTLELPLMSKTTMANHILDTAIKYMHH